MYWECNGLCSVGIRGSEGLYAEVLSLLLNSLIQPVFLHRVNDSICQVVATPDKTQICKYIA